MPLWGQQHSSTSQERKHMNCEFDNALRHTVGTLEVSCTETGVGLVDPDGPPPSQHILLFYGSMILCKNRVTW